MEKGEEVLHFGWTGRFLAHDSIPNCILRFCAAKRPEDIFCGIKELPRSSSWKGAVNVCVAHQEYMHHFAPTFVIRDQRDSRARRIRCGASLSCEVGMLERSASGPGQVPNISVACWSN